MVVAPATCFHKICVFQLSDSWNRNFFWKMHRQPCLGVQRPSANFQSLRIKLNSWKQQNSPPNFSQQKMGGKGKVEVNKKLPENTTQKQAIADVLLLNALRPQPFCFFFLHWDSQMVSSHLRPTRWKPLASELHIGGRARSNHFLLFSLKAIHRRQ